MTIPTALIELQNLIFKPANFQCSEVILEPESAEYGACHFKLNNLLIRFREAKITPTKIGQFVTLWKRIGKSPIMPFDLSDEIDLFVICVQKDNHFGQFVFPTSILHKQDIISENHKGGKRAIRVYPAWDKTESRQAQKTQSWQSKYFLEIPKDKPIDILRIKQLYCL